jgi:hypothetical protein
MNVNHLYFLFEENMMKSLNFQTHISLQSPPLYFLFYFFEIPEIFSFKTPNLEYVNFATPCIINYFFMYLVFVKFTNAMHNIK